MLTAVLCRNMQNVALSYSLLLLVDRADRTLAKSEAVRRGEAALRCARDHLGRARRAVAEEQRPDNSRDRLRAGSDFTNVSRWRGPFLTLT